jgi:hypothetical protein
MSGDFSSDFSIDFSKIYLYKWGELFYVEFETLLAADAFKKIINNNEAFSVSEGERFRTMIANDSFFWQSLNEDQGSYYAQFYEREERLISELHYLQRNSILLMIFSFFEGSLNKLCILIEKQFKLKVKLKNFKADDDLSRYWLYLVDVLEIEEASALLFFTRIKQIKYLRNRIAHHNGTLPKENAPILRFNGITLENFGDDTLIRITSTELLLNLLKDVEDFFKKILLEIDKRYKEKGN